MALEGYQLYQLVGSRREFRIMGTLGRGGTGVVFEAARVGSDDSRFAVKVYVATDGMDERQLLLLKSHERAVAERIAHEGVGVSVVDEDEHCLIFSKIEGRTLAEELNARTRLGALTVAGMAELFAPIAQFLDTMHAAGVVHRDLKSTNVMVVPARGWHRAIIIDYGHALLDGAHPVIENGGTQGYAAPEQLAGKAATAKTDVFALGVMMWEALTGKPLFSPKETAESILVQLRRRPAEALGSKWPEPIPTLVAAMLQADPDLRPDAGQVVDALMPFLSGAPRQIASESTSRRTTGQLEPRVRNASLATRLLLRVHSTRRSVLGLVGFTALALTAGAYVRVSHNDPAMRPPAHVEAAAAAARPAPAPTPPPLSLRVPPRDECAAFAGLDDFACVPAMEVVIGNTQEDIDRLCQHLGKRCTTQVRLTLLRSKGAHKVRLDTFAMQRKETTCSQYLGYLRSHVGTMTWVNEFHGHDNAPPERRYAFVDGVLAYDPGAEDNCIGWNEKAQDFYLKDRKLANRPVDFVTQYSAERYCESIGGTLPTEAQFEAIARGSDNALYASRSRPECADLAFDQVDDPHNGVPGECRALPSSKKGMRSVGTTPFDVVPKLRIYDLMGNGLEWTADKFISPYPPCPGGVCVNPRHPVTVRDPSASDPDLAAVRGASFAMPRHFMFSSTRGRIEANTMNHGLTFRCVLSLPQGGKSQ